MGSEDTFIFSVLLQTKILPPLMSGPGVYVTKPGKYAMVSIHYLQDWSRRRFLVKIFKRNKIYFTAPAPLIKDCIHCGLDPSSLHLVYWWVVLMPRQADIFASTKSSSVTNCKTDKSNSHRINTNVFIGNYSSFQTRGMIDDSSFVITVSLWYFEMRTKDKSNIFTR